MFDYKFLGSRIRATRLERKITQEKLAEAAGVGVTLLCMEVRQSRPMLNNWLGELVADCSDSEVKLITDMVVAMKASMRRLKLSDSADE